MENKILKSPLNFSQALEKLKLGKRIRRTGWTEYLQLCGAVRIRKFTDGNSVIYTARSPDLLAHDWAVL
ncbi:MAG: hypothetical protein COB56_01125 [Robiginitomaculum sp.]|nr:MAG: hypothetical protein COB56_01125 [Robiginitomaculum sp.]